MDENNVPEIENTEPLYKDSPFDKGYFMMWLCGQDEKTGKYIYDARKAIDYFQTKYNRICRQIAMGKKNDIDGVEQLDILVPKGQIWIR